MDREAVAKREIGRTEIGRGLAQALVVCFLAVLAAVPSFDLLAGRLAPVPAQSAPAAATDGCPRGLFAANRAAQSWVRRFEDRVAERSVLRDMFLGPARIVLGHWLRSGSETVCVGSDGWLFFRPAVDHLTGAPFLDPAQQEARRRAASELERVPAPDPLPAILQFRDELAERGIELILLPVPVKAAVHPERLSARHGRSAATLANASYADFVDWLRRENVPLLDPGPVLQEIARENGSAYLARDTHWTPAAVQRVAALLAGRLQECGVRTGCVEFHVRAGRIEAWGDLARMFSPPGRAPLFGPETVDVLEVGPSAAGIAPVSPDGSEVLLLGDSFTAIYSDPHLQWGRAAGLGEHLALALGAPVEVVARNDQGAFATRLELAAELARGRDRLAGKRVVVWQFAARELSFGDWRVVPLPEAVPGKRPEAPRRAPWIAHCEIEQLGRFPQPGGTPYRDHLTWMLLRPLEERTLGETAAGEADGTPILAYVRTLVDDRPGPAAGLAAGHRVRFRLTPWETVEPELGRLRRDEPDDTALLAYDPWLATPLPANFQDSVPAEIPERAAGMDRAGAGTDPSAAAERPQGEGMSGKTALAEVCARLAAAGEGMTVRGVDGWLFHRAELRQMTLPSFTDPDALRAYGDARPPNQADPVAAIAAYAEACRQRGVRLLLAPIPAKSAVYPDKLDGSLQAPASADARADHAHRDILARFEAEGVEVLDVLELFLSHRDGPGDPLFCRTDTHFSGRACQVLAAALAARIREEPWAESLLPRTWRRDRRSTTIDGDLRRALEDQLPPAEELELYVVSDAVTGEPPPIDPQSPVLILADSHGLVFHAGGDMHAVGAGLADCLAVELGSTVDLIAVRGSAARPARISLYRRGRSDPDWLARKRIIVWCFTVREFTDSPWGVVPLAP